MLGYAELETALAQLHGADVEAQRGAFRGRLKHLQRLGLPLGIKPGRGKRVEYGDDEAHQFLLALELAQCGIDPTVIVEFIKQFWDRLLRDQIQRAGDVSKRAQDRLLVITPGLMSAAWEDASASLYGLRRAGWSDSHHFFHSFDKERRRAIVINISDALREFRHLLKAEEER
jgi:hypothetical protein